MSPMLNATMSTVTRSFSFTMDKVVCWGAKEFLCERKSFPHGNYKTLMEFFDDIQGARAQAIINYFFQLIKINTSTSMPKTNVRRSIKCLGLEFWHFTTLDYCSFFEEGLIVINYFSPAFFRPFTDRWLMAHNCRVSSELSRLIFNGGIND